MFHKSPGNREVLFLEHPSPEASRSDESSRYIYQIEGNSISYKTRPHNMMSTHAFLRNDVIIKIRGKNDVKTHFNEKSRIFMIKTLHFVCLLIIIEIMMKKLHKLAWYTDKIESSIFRTFDSSSF